MTSITTYIFVDQDDIVVDECGFLDDEAAEKHGERLMKQKNMVVGVYREISILDPIDYK